MPGTAIPGDPATPASARVYNYLHGGDDWYAPDRELAGRLEEVYPGVRRIAVNNRAYIGHAVLFASARLRIRQYLDLGSGFPSPGSVRDIAQAADPATVIACVDHDPVVAHPEYGYGPVLDGAGVKGVTVTLADIRDTTAVLAAPGVAGLLNFDEPALIVLGMVANHMSGGDAQAVAEAYAAVLTPGSAMVVTVPVADDKPVGDRLAEEWDAGTGENSRNYTHGEVEAMFAGLDIQPPGVGPIAGRRPGWDSSKGKAPGTCHVIGGIGVKPLPQRRSKKRPEGPHHMRSPRLA